MNSDAPGMTLGFDQALIDGLIASSQDAMALSLAFGERGQKDMAALWARFADFLVASEVYVAPAPDSRG